MSHVTSQKQRISAKELVLCNLISIANVRIRSETGEALKKLNVSSFVHGVVVSASTVSPKDNDILS